MAEPPFGHNDMYFLRMKQKIRMILRIAAKHGHTKLVLGNLGSGDGAEDAAKSFLEVFQEDEFQGGWWEYVFFAVMDKSKNAGPGDDRTYGYVITPACIEITKSSRPLCYLCRLLGIRHILPCHIACADYLDISTGHWMGKLSEVSEVGRRGSV